MTTVTDATIAPVAPGSQSFLLKRVQPALSGLMDGSLSTLAPIFAVVLATHHPLTAFFTGAATALGAGVSMAFSEGLSDTGDLTGRGSPVLRGAITGGGTFAGGIFHTLPCRPGGGRPPHGPGHSGREALGSTEAPGHSGPEALGSKKDHGRSGREAAPVIAFLGTGRMG